METARRTRIAVVGVGAVGGAVAADLADLKRHELVLCVRTPFERLEVKHPGGVSIVEAPVVTSPAEARAPLGGQPADWLLLATKAHQAPAATPWLDALCGPSTRIAVLQNGVDHVERVEPLAPAGSRVLPVVIQLPSETTGPGRVEQSRDGVLFVPDDEAGRDFAGLFEGARNRVRPTDDFVTQAWWKLLANAALGGVCALVTQPGRIAREPDVRELVLALMREVAAVGAAEGAKLPEDAPEKALDLMLRAAADHLSSITADRVAGRPMEWEARNAVVGRLGRRHGIATPLNDALTTLLRVVDVGYPGGPDAPSE